jgi:hypothetical protein
MSTQPEALRLADACDLGYPLEEDARQAAAELRRLHEANEAFGKRQEWWNERMFVLEQQRDALLAALRPFAAADLTSPTVRDTFGFDVLHARAAIKMVEEGK